MASSKRGPACGIEFVSDQPVYPRCLIRDFSLGLGLHEESKTGKASLWLYLSIVCSVAQAELSIFCTHKSFGSLIDASGSRARGPGFDSRSGNLLSFILPLIQDGQLSIAGESMCT